MAKKALKGAPRAKILTVNLPAHLHRRFLKEAGKYNGNGGRENEKFLFAIMRKYLALSKKRRARS